MTGVELPIRDPATVVGDVQANEDRDEGKPAGVDDKVRLLTLGMVLITELVVNILSASMVPFFPDFAEDRWGASHSEVGTVFALYPLSLFVTSLFAGLLAQRIGRLTVFSFGLLLLGGGTWAFGFSDSLAKCMGVRVIQGMGGGFIQVAGMALLLQVSNNVERDIGLDQGAIGLGFIIGPPVGALLYSSIGFRNLYLFLGAIPLAGVPFLPYMAKRIPPVVTPPPTTDKLSSPLAAGASSSSSSSSTFMSMLTRPIVLTGLSMYMSFSALGLLDPLALPHLERTLGASIEMVGAIFMIPVLVFVIISLFAEQVAKKIGFRRAIAGGIIVMVIALLIMGPAPILIELPWTRTSAWVVQMTGFIFFGIGFAFVVVTAVPLMNSYLPDAGHEKQDFISSVNSACGSLGEFTGPFLGGFMADLMPQRMAVSCRPTEQVPDCLTGVSYTTLTFASFLVVALLAFMLLTPEPKTVQEKAMNQASATARVGDVEADCKAAVE